MSLSSTKAMLHWPTFYSAYSVKEHLNYAKSC